MPGGVAIRCRLDGIPYLPDPISFNGTPDLWGQLVPFFLFCYSQATSHDGEYFSLGFPQIIEAIDNEYLAAIRNHVTGKITPLVPNILEFLHNNCGRITPHKLDDKTSTIKAMI